MRTPLHAVALLMVAGQVSAQELEPRAYSPAPVGMTIVLNSIGRSRGEIVLDPSLGAENVQADLWIALGGFGYTFGIAGHQARLLVLLPFAWGDVTGQLQQQTQKQDLTGLVDPRFKLSVGLVGAPALQPKEFANAPRRTVVGASLTIVPPWGQYDPEQLVNLGYNRWAFKPEVGVSHAFGSWTVESYAGVWLFTVNNEYFPGHARHEQNPVVAVQGHVSHSLIGKTWFALDGTWFGGGDSQTDDAPSHDLQRNGRLGATFAVPITGLHTLKLSLSTGLFTRRGSDFDTVNLTWQWLHF